MKLNFRILGSKTWALQICLIGSFIGCYSEIPLPEGFVEISGGDHYLRATSSEGGAYRVDLHENPRGGTQEYWMKTLQRTLKEAYSYEITEAKTVEDKGGQILSSSMEQGQKFIYLVHFQIDDEEWMYVHDYAAIDTLAEKELGAIYQAIEQTY